PFPNRPSCLTWRYRDAVLEIDEGVDDGRNEVVIEGGARLMVDRSILSRADQHCRAERHHGQTNPEAPHSSSFGPAFGRRSEGALSAGSTARRRSYESAGNWKGTPGCAGRCSRYLRTWKTKSGVAVPPA